MTHNLSLFVPETFRRLFNALPVIGASKSHPLPVEGIGSVIIPLGNNKFLTLLNVLYVPNIVQNLINTYKLQESGYQCLLNPIGMGMPHCVINKNNKFFYLPVETEKNVFRASGGSGITA
jgi:hypothetical protein